MPALRGGRLALLWKGYGPAAGGGCWSGGSDPGLDHLQSSAATTASLRILFLVLALGGSL